MKTLNIAAATVLGIGVGLGAGVLVKAPEAQAGLPPGTYWCWSHLVPNYQKCPDIPPWGSRWKACGSNPVLFVLDDRNEVAALKKAQAQLAKDRATLVDMERQVARGPRRGPRVRPASALWDRSFRT